MGPWTQKWEAENQGHGGRASVGSRTPGATGGSDEEGVASKGPDHERQEGGMQGKLQPKELSVGP